MIDADTTAVRLCVASLLGLSVGLEREWSGHADGANPRFAGVRTFMLLGGLGGIAGWLASSDMLAIAVALLLGAGALIVAAYYAAARAGSVEGTTEVAALVVVALAVLAGLGQLGVAGGSTAIVVLALSEKARVHRVVQRIGETELRAALQFAVLALVVLPVLPNESYGPLGGFQPRTLWMIVLLFSALNFAGYLARKAIGDKWGDSVTGILGGVVSSTAVTWHFSRLSRKHEARSRPLAIGVVGACTVLMVRVSVVSLSLEPSVALAVVPYLVGPFVAGVAYVAIFMLRDKGRASRAHHEDEVHSPLGLWNSIKMAIAFQIALMAVVWVRERFNAPGVRVSAVLLGLTDMDALTLSMNRMGKSEELVALAAQAIAIGVVTNSLFKLTVAGVMGSPAFRRVVLPGLGLLALATGAALWLLTL